jgi:predicted  nucleic acid-binding Zn-ribbon protein
MEILAPVSAGELVDKITILRVKSQRLTDTAKLANVALELTRLEETATQALPKSEALDRLTAELEAINAILWDVEEGKRDCERRKDFGPAFIALARQVYHDNDKRAAIKRAINNATGSTIIEEKSYAAY